MHPDDMVRPARWSLLRGNGGNYCLEQVSPIAARSQRSREVVKAPLHTTRTSYRASMLVSSYVCSRVQCILRPDTGAQREPRPTPDGNAPRSGRRERPTVSRLLPGAVQIPGPRMTGRPCASAPVLRHNFVTNGRESAGTSTKPSRPRIPKMPIEQAKTNPAVPSGTGAWVIPYPAPKPYFSL